MDLGGRVDRQAPTRAPACADDGDIDRRVAGGPEIPEGRGVAMTEQRTLAAGNYGSHPVALSIERPHGIDPSMHAAESPIRRAALDYRGMDSERDELPSGNDTMLTIGKPGYEGVEHAHRRPPPHRGGGGIGDLVPIWTQKSVTPAG